VLLEKALDDSDSDVRAAVPRSLGKAKSGDLAALASKVLAHKDPRVRSNAFEALGESPTPEQQLAVIEKMLGDLDETVTANAGERLDQFRGKGLPAVLLRVLTGPSPGGRMVAADHLYFNLFKAALDPLLQQYRVEKDARVKKKIHDVLFDRFPDQTEVRALDGLPPLPPRGFVPVDPIPAQGN
jgi:HEAT repeat protein